MRDMLSDTGRIRLVRRPAATADRRLADTRRVAS